MSQLIDHPTSSQFDRLPPHSIDAERALLGSMSIDREATETALMIIDRDAFFQTDHQIIFDVLKKLYEAGTPVDVVVLSDELGRRQLLEEIGGNAYLGQILGAVPSSAHVAHYAKIVRDKWVLRSLIAASNDTLRECYSPHEATETIADRAEVRIFDITDRRTANQIGTMQDAMIEAFDRIEDKGTRGIETGFHELDDITNGLHEGEMIIIAARPSVGKTAFALNILDNIASAGKLVGFFSLEMGRRELAQRLLCSRANVDAQKVRKGMTSAQEFSRLMEAMKQESPSLVDDTGSLSIMEFRAKARRMCRAGAKAIAVDYLQLMTANADSESRQQGISEISRGIKSVARELKIPILALSQLNRQTESREGHRPRISDLRESGSLEQDADVIFLLHREDYYRMTEPNFVPDNIAEVIVAKQRNGPTGTIKLTFDNRTTTFRNLAAQIDPMF